MERNLYLNKLPLEQAREKYFSRFKDKLSNPETMATAEAAGRITAEAVYARRSAPHFYAAAMDGIAIRAADTAGASQRTPVYLKQGEEAAWVDTGEAIPGDFNAVIKVEEVNEVKTGELEIEKGVTPWENVRTIGESVIKEQLILPINHRITPYDIGGLLEAGVTELRVRQKPRIGIIPTGTEIVDPGTTPDRGQHIEFNSAMFRAYAREWGAEVRVTGIVDDDYNIIKEKLLQQVESSDITVIIAGSSAGREDYTLKLIQNLGQVMVHGVNIMPGKPVVLGQIEDKPVVGIPGYPLSALLDYYLFVKSLVRIYLGQSLPEKQRFQARVKRKVPSKTGLREYLRVNLARIGEELIAVPRARGSAAMDSLINADGIMTVPQQKEGLAPESRGQVFLLKSPTRINKALLFMGSHDLALDILRNQLAGNRTDFSLNLQSVGSMAGLMALKRGECHLAGAHLLDRDSGQYNRPYLEKYIPGREIALITLVHRCQGLMVKPGNPRELQQIEDLTGDITFINRQRGSGTRILLDYWLDQQGLSPEAIRGYGREEYTHIGAASAVASGSADTALGILAAARALDLDFIPLMEERYDLMLPAALLEDRRIRELRKILESTVFQKKVEELGGYRTDDSGKLDIVGGSKSG